VSRVLLVSIILIGRTGTEVVCCETARGLRRRNHEVIIYTQQAGATADQLRAEGFEVTTDLASLNAVPDVIQANQTYPLLEAVGRFPGTPAISICHDAVTWHSEPVDLPAIRRHVAVDLACRDRIASRFPHLADRIEILHNAVDLDAYRPRAPLPPRPKRALILAKHPSYLDAVQAACAGYDIDLDVLGPAVGVEVDDLPSLLGRYDLVFASARSALEAMAAGCAVIVIDSRGLAGLVTSAAVSSWREDNFGLRLLSREASGEAVAAEIERYDALDAQRVSGFIRENSSLARYLDRLEAMYREVAAEALAQPVDRDELVYQMSRSFRPIEHGLRAQRDLDLANFARSKQAEFEVTYMERARAREAELNAAFEQRLRAREAELRADFQEQARRREAELQQRADAELQRQAGSRQAEFEAYRAWVAPRNLHHRIIRKLRRLIGA
jgi:hypothetical protein